MKFIVLALAVACAYAVPTSVGRKEWRTETDCKDCFEGDIKIPPGKSTRNGVIDESYRWPNGTVYYRFDDGFDVDKMNTILTIWEDYPFYTDGCIKMEPWAGVGNSVLITNNNNEGCYSYIGMIDSILFEQNINYPDWCIDQYGSVLHEMLHCLGFYHQQSTYDRDDYVTIQEENITPGAEGNFEKESESEVSDFGTEYDYDSVMHYSGRAFSENGEYTIRTKNITDQPRIGQRDGFSSTDVVKLMRMYKCPGA